MSGSTGDAGMGGSMDPSRPWRLAATHYGDHRYRVREELLRSLADELGWSNSTRLLDLCCGPAHLSIPLARIVGEVVALDIEPEMVAEGKLRAATAGVNTIEFVVGRAEDAEHLVGGQFDAATIGWGVHWIADHDALLAMLDRLVVPGGAVVIVGDRTRGAAHPSTPLASRLEKVLDRFLDAPTAPLDPPPQRAPFDVLVRESAFCEVTEIVDTYAVIEDDGIEAAIGRFYTVAGVLERLGDRRAEFEEEARRELYSVTRGRRRSMVTRREHVLIARKQGA